MTVRARRGRVGRRVRLPAALLGPLLVVALILLAGPAAATTPLPPEVDIESVTLTPEHARLAISAANLPPGVESDVRAFADGVPIPVRFAEQATTTSAGPRAVMLLLDASLSMAGSGIEAARQAATEYLRGLPPDVQVGLVSFAERPELLVPPTTDRARTAAALARVAAQGNTALYDAVGVAVSALDAAGLGPSAERRLVILSDGVDTASTASLAAAVDALATRGITADVVAFRYGEKDTSAVNGLAAAAGGRVLSADDAPQLAGALETVAGHFGMRATLEVDLPSDAAGRSIELLVRVGGAPANTVVRVPAAAAPATAPPPPPPSPSTLPLPLLAVLAAVFAALLLLVLLVLGPPPRPDHRGRRLATQIARYGPSRPTSAEDEGKLTRSAVDAVTSLLQTLKIEQKLVERLDLAAIARQPAHWVLTGCGLCAVLAVGLTVFTGSALLGFPLGALAGWLGMRFFLTFRISRRRAAFAEQLPDVLQLVAGSLQSGFSLQQALDAVVRDGTQPAAGETSRALVQTRIGVALETALDRIADRMDSVDMRWVVMVIRIQREVGGNLAEVLLTTVGTMRERAQTRRQVRALSAEGRFSAYILIALPIGVGGFLFWSSPDYVRPLVTTGMGMTMLIAAGVMIGLGALWMRKLVNVEV